MKKSKTVQCLKKWSGVLFGILLGGICGLATANYVFFLEDEYLIFLGEFEFLFMLLVSIYIALFLQIIIHEAGHLIFGLMSGYRFCSFRVFSFIWMKENGKIKLKRLSLVGTAGQCLMAPPDLVNGKIPIVLYHLGGVTMNLISAVIFWKLHMATLLYPFAALIFLDLSLIGVGYAVMNGVPMNLGVINNDGNNTMGMLKNQMQSVLFGYR